MAKSKADHVKGQRIRGAGTEALEAAQAERAGTLFERHFGRVKRLGNYEVAGCRGLRLSGRREPSLRSRARSATNNGRSSNWHS